MADLTERVRALYREALEVPIAERARFVAEHAAGDPELLAEVEGLLAHEPTEAGAEPVSTAPRPGSRLGAFIIEDRIGAGGMGEVFRALDTRLDRRVAIKVCATRFDERFDREVKALSALNHPHICTLYDVGPNYLVMELLDGETLATRIERGSLLLADAARHGAQIAEALAEAHRAGIVHRDLKPQNVMLTRHGIKVLDFGIAKILQDDSLTRTGAIIGPAAYLAPEQLAGESVTERSDLYALGVLLHEMAAGRRPLLGEPAAKIVASIAASARSRGERATAGAFAALVVRLLQPIPARRVAAAAEVASQLRAIAERSPARPSTRQLVAAAAVAAIAVAVGGWWAVRSSEDAAPLRVARLAAVTTFAGPKSDPAYSFDGTALAFVWEGPTGSEPGVYVLRDGETVPVRLTLSASDVSPTWSPDGAQVAFLRVRPGQSNELMVVSVPQSGASASPTERKLRDVVQSELVIRLRRPVITWAPDGNAIVVPLPDGDSGLTSLFRVPLDGSAPRRIIASRGGQGDSAPAISRDGRWLAYAELEAQRSQLYLAALGADGIATGPPEAVPGALGGIRTVVLSPDGQQVFWNTGAQLMALRRGGVRTVAYVAGDTFQSLTARWNGSAVADFVFANVGSGMQLRELTLRDGGRAAAGPAVPLVRVAGSSAHPALSPDGRWLAFQAPVPSGDGALWLAGARGENPRPIATLPLGTPILWSADSRSLTFHVRLTTFAQVYVVEIDESGAVTSTRQVTESPFSLFSPAWSANGRHLYATSVRDPTALRIVRVPAQGGDLEPLFDGICAKVSIDGTRIFYGRSLQPGIFERSLEGDVAANAEALVLEDYTPSCGFIPGERGLFYVGRDEQRRAVALRFFDFAERRSYDLGPPPQDQSAALTLSPDGTRIVFEVRSSAGSDLTRIELTDGR